jgi:benzoyl-CoA 2,3-dioxygenase component B
MERSAASEPDPGPPTIASEREPVTNVTLNEKIPNNVNLSGDRRLQRALEAWQPHFLQWWQRLGPIGYQDHDVYLRTAISVGRDGWAHFDYVKMPEYRWGIFLAEPEPNRAVGFGDRLGEPLWQDVPGEFRASLRRLVVVQGDTEPASVEQQRHLCQTAPSLYDLRNLCQVNVEDGREEADMLLERHSGDADNPRILGAFNEPTPDWLSFFMFTYFTDRDGKFQLASLAESAFDPLARTCQFMLKEEAYHMFVGAGGVGRIVQRTADLMREHDTADVAAYGGINLDTLQRYLNLHYSVSLDLFGAETSTNAANYFASGLKGRFQEASREDDHRLLDHEVAVPEVVGGRVAERQVPALAALNNTLRIDYLEDCQKGVDRWNRTLATVDAELRLPHAGFHRAVGTFAEHCVTPEGQVVSTAEWDAQRAQWLPTDADREHVASVMRPVTKPGLMASWVAAPASGIHAKPVDFEYVRI